MSEQIVHFEPKIVEPGELLAAGFQQAYTWETVDQISKLWDQVYTPRMHEFVNGTGTCLGICYQCTEQGFHYMAAAALTTLEQVPAGMETMTIPAHRYVAVTVQGDPLKKIGAAFEFIEKWIVENGHQRLDNALALEVYDERFTNDTDLENSALDIYVAIK